MKRVYISVINDLLTDQRVHRVAKMLALEGTEVICIGRLLPDSMEAEEVPFRIDRFRLLFNKGPLLYISYNLRLFFKLLFARKADLFISNDLDTLLASYLAGRIRRIPLIYDSHELFTQVPELIHRKGVQSIWLCLERILVPRVRYAVTVSDSIATIYRRLYGTPFRVVRNMPEKGLGQSPESNPQGRPAHQIIIYQGALNVGRGIELVIDAMQHVEEARFVIAGSGDIEEDLKRRVEAKGVSERVEFAGRLLPADLASLTVQANLGISLEEDLGLNYRYALPNKLFNYIQCHVPVLCSSLPEMARIVESYGVGVSTAERDPEKLAGIIKFMLKEAAGGTWKEALHQAAEELCWEKESVVYRDLLQECGVIGRP